MTESPHPVSESRKQFEEWFSRVHHTRLSRNMPDRSYNDPLAHNQWESWQASRAKALEAAIAEISLIAGPPNDVWEAAFKVVADEHISAIRSLLDKEATK